MNFIRKVKEDLKNPKKKSLTLLGLYAIFFIIVFIIFNIGETGNNKYVEQHEEKINYDYTYKVYQNDSYVDIVIDNDLSYDVIQELIKNSYSETKYKDNNEVLYGISADKYFEILNDVDSCDNMDCSMISILIKVEENKNFINATIDLSNYYEDKYIIEINYYTAVKDWYYER